MTASDQQIAEYMAMTFVGQLLRKVGTDALVRGGTAVEFARLATALPDRLALGLSFATSAGVLECDAAGSFRMNANLRRNSTQLFRLVKFLGAYGGPIESGWSYWSGEREAISADPVMLAEAYDLLSHRRLKSAPDAIAGLPISHLLELACGSAPVSRELARRKPEMRALAIDESAAMVALARRCIKRDALQGRIDVRQATLSDIINGSETIPDTVDCAVLRGVANSFFGEGTLKLTAILEGLAERLRGKYLVVSDYFGELGQPGSDMLSARCQDIAQLLSGQGIPPHDSMEWDAIYDAAGLVLVQRHVDTSLVGAQQFIDILRVPKRGSG